MAALPRILDRFPVDNVLWSGNLDASYSAEELDRWLAAQRYPGHHCLCRRRAGPRGRRPAWRCSSVSPRGAVLLVEWQGFRPLLPVGMNFDTLSRTGERQSHRPGDSPAAGRFGLRPLQSTRVDQCPAPPGG